MLPQPLRSSLPLSDHLDHNKLSEVKLLVQSIREIITRFSRFANIFGTSKKSGQLLLGVMGLYIYQRNNVLHHCLSL